MPVYHIVLFRLKEGVTQEQIAAWKEKCHGMVGKIPGLVSLKSGVPLPISIPRAHGFDMGLVAVLETAEHIATYAVHPAHLEVHKMREELCDDTLAYDLEF
ncbi:Dimeric alpha-beta barrel [Penicillium sp. DV-2018c]|nr:Dimeric alpha-beta barrel [Penicillium sp. DV-2018c]KAJ5576895.1 Dimeric alpha-beta barrel [Penicillium sp. DV-2018c]